MLATPAPATAAPQALVDPQVVALVDALTSDMIANDDLLRAIQLGLVHELAFHCQKNQTSTDDGDSEITSTSLSFLLRLPAPQHQANT